MMSSVSDSIQRKCRNSEGGFIQVRIGKELEALMNDWISETMQSLPLCVDSKSE